MATDTKTAFEHVNVDQRAWEFAKMQLGPDATLTDVIARAQRYKDAMLRNDEAALEGLSI